ncbi:uncharacterized protein LOC143260626 [Megalopta genalis]|uniref:uncharacterized protein LOC143260626 n=1 Tax=Megalopta genalis TaxID=115081 RepID=UPI003FCF56EC
MRTQFEIEGEDVSSDHDAERDAFEKHHATIMNSINLRKNSLRNTHRPNLAIRNSTESPNTIKVTQASSLLPQIQIRPFDGNPLEWNSFRDTFDSLVHQNEDLPAVQKFHLLKNALRGEIASVITSLTASEENYIVAWELLQKRCNKRRQIVYAHLKSLLELQDVKVDSPDRLRVLAEQAEVHVNALKALEQPVQHWSTFLVYLISNKLDRNTRRAWDRTLENHELPQFGQLVEFINKHGRGDERDNRFARPNQQTQIVTRSREKQRYLGQTFVTTNSRIACKICKGEHFVSSCPKLLEVTPGDRLDIIKRGKLCINCLRSGHTVAYCRYTNCKKCGKKHHTLLHIAERETNSQSEIERPTSPSSTPQTSRSFAVNSCNEVLLGTAIVTFVARDKSEHDCRVLLDSGSQTNFITERMADKLQLRKREIDSSVGGIANVETRVKYLVNAVIKSRTTQFNDTVTLVTLPSITGMLPSRQAKQTLVGWIVTGATTKQEQVAKGKPSRSLHASSLDNALTKFWEIEEIAERKNLSSEEQACENHFVENTVRDVHGRYIVRLPFNDRKNFIGESRGLALKRFYSLERKFCKDPDLLIHYKQFLSEYLALGHMTEVSDARDGKEFYLPHHAVIKECSCEAKVRVVFDASTKSSSGVSLNDALLVGPTIQDNLWAILLRFRFHMFVLTADIEKMFRQIKMHPDDAKFQKILWRDSKEESIKTFQLNTVTYGTASAPFLAVRCLQQLAEDEQIRFPNASRTFKEDFYVDDLLTGASTFNEAINLRNELIDLARNGGFHLRQWASNNHKLISDLKDHDDRQAICLDLSQTKKTLGVFWNPSSDSVTYAVNSFSETRLTKRIVLSQIAQLFDPLGLLGPVIIRAKIIMQDIWKSKVTWDQPIPQDIAEVWLETRNELAQLDNFSCPRRVMLETSREIQLHGYCDASERAYGACIYICTLDHSGRWIRTAPHLLKTFVANRVSEIQTYSDPRNWVHVSGRDNPADYISRGQLASTFMNNKVWLNGPAWLSLDECFWPQLDIPQREILERKPTITFLAREGTNDLSKNRLTGNLSTTEIRKAHLVIIKQAQLEVFPIEINCLERKAAMPKGSRILNLNPFLDQDKLLRVGGRLRHAPLSYCQKHPLLLPHRVKPKVPVYIMGDLPKNRVTRARPFQNVGVDYCGPFFIKEKKVRNRCKIKTYVAIFVCFVTKAVHLELTSDLTTESCLGAFKRFFARRGKATNIYSDNGTNFVGAKNEITEVQRFLSSNEHNSKINRFFIGPGN